jgi:hypothetical protein
MIGGLKMKDFEGTLLFSGLLILFLVLIGYLNNWEFIKDIWNLLQDLSQLLSNFFEKI